MLIVALAIKIDSKGPVLFKQERIGKNGKVFKIYKFRSMRVNSEHTGSGVYSGKGDDRLTKVGKFIRATSIDELPQFLNILKGEMSFIGPRPPLTYHPWKYEEYSDQQKRMFEVRPGITGWAQVNGRKGVEWHKRIQLNVWYVDNVSFWLDVKILFKTIGKVFSNADNENKGATLMKNDLKLMYITSSGEVAKVAEAAGVDRIFVDMEYIGKNERQGGKDTVKSGHTLDDVSAVKAAISKAELMVRVNPIHEGGENTLSSKEEIDGAIERGADAIMLPYFKTVEEAKAFIDMVGGRAKTVLLMETPEAVAAVDEIVKLRGVDEIFIGLNDLSLGYGQKFMFEPLADGTVDKLADKFRENGKTFGFGGIASLGKGLVKSEEIIAEHYRLGSSEVILSRSFCNIQQVGDINEVERIFKDGVKEIRDYEKKCRDGEVDLDANRKALVESVARVVKEIK